MSEVAASSRAPDRRSMVRRRSTSRTYTEVTVTGTGKPLMRLSS